ncbi:Protein regulator of cytokinesis 1 [Forsythia ovata]|uniref:Protein regulator of cytokinesis 1 n=1 Tax=Forsythia ovata TaxID=205694 RepID=A0ABD1S1Q4_9LAMI
MGKRVCKRIGHIDKSSLVTKIHEYYHLKEKRQSHQDAFELVNYVPVTSKKCVSMSKQAMEELLVDGMPASYQSDLQGTKAFGACSHSQTVTPLLQSLISRRMKNKCMSSIISTLCTAQAARVKILALIDSSNLEPVDLSADMDNQIVKSKEEALSRKAILDKVEKWMSSCKEESCLEDYNRDIDAYFEESKKQPTPLSARASMYRCHGAPPPRGGISLGGAAPPYTNRSTLAYP